MEYKLIVDSCADFNEKEFKDVERVPFIIEIDEKEYVDKEGQVTDALIEKNYITKSIKTACPSPGDFADAVKDAANAFIVTISSKLSGAYQSAMMAKDQLLGQNIHVFDSKSAAVGENLIILKIKELMDKELPHFDIVEKTNEYIDKMKTIFSLDTLDTLVSNGRVSIAKNLACKALKIFPIMSADENGRIIMKSVARGRKNALNKLVDLISETKEDLSQRVLGITHVNDRQKAEELKRTIEERYSFKDVLIFEASGLSSVYACNSGIILAY